MLSRVFISSARSSTRMAMVNTTFSMFSTDSSNPVEEQEVQINVPKNFVRFIIGPKGANAQKLTEASGGARLKFQKEVSADGQDEIGRIFGTAEQVAEMKRLIEEDVAKLERDPPAAGGAGQAKQGEYVEEIIVDAQYVGFLIGKGGSLLKEMEQSSGARIRYSDAEGNKPDRTARLSGSYEQVQAVKKQISDKLFERQEEHRANPERFSRFGGQKQDRRAPRFNENDVKQVVEVPSDIVGALIGKGGLALHRMQDDTGAKFDFAKDETRPGVKEVTIYGREEQIQNACDLLQSRVQEINSRNSSRH